MTVFSLPVPAVLLGLLLLCPFPARALDPKRSASTVVLNETGVRNLRIETTEAEEADFEETAFALGRLAAIPSRIGAVSSRISGRIVALPVTEGDSVQEGQEVARVESRMAGDPPPTVVLRAPLSGLVTAVRAHLGDPLNPEHALMEITDLSAVWAVAQVPEHLAGRIKPGTPAHITVTALPGEKLEGELLRFGTAAEAQSGTIPALFRLPNASGLLRPEMRAEFAIVLSRRAGVMSVPRSALQGDAAGRFVYVEDFEVPHAFVKTEVAVGQVNDRFAEVLQGLLPGDKVVTRGGYSLAFAGGGSVSLKEALDAAHGHEHAEDGSELTPAKRAELARAHGAADHAGEGPAPASLRLWQGLSAFLLLLFLGTLFYRRSGAREEAAC